MDADGIELKEGNNAFGSTSLAKIDRVTLKDITTYYSTEFSEIHFLFYVSHQANFVVKQTCV